MDLFSDHYITRDERNQNRDFNRAISARQSQQFNVVRRVYEQDTLNKDAEYQEPIVSVGRKVKKCIHRCGFVGCITHALPIMYWLPKYKIKEYLVGDLVAGATVAVMHIPQGMAYALLAEVPPIVGLYMAFFPVLMYVLLGTSPHISMGTFALACLMTGKIVTQHTAQVPSTLHLPQASLDLLPPPPTADMVPLYSSSQDPYTPLEVVSVVCLTVGLIQIGMWMLRLGALSTLLSEPMVSGFTTAATIHVLSSQLKDLFGLTLPKLDPYYKVIFTLIEVCKRLPTLNWVAFITSCIACAIISFNNELIKPRIAKRCKIPVPIELMAIVLGTLVSRFVDLKGNYGITLVGQIPTGLPIPQIPRVELISEVVLDSFTITMVTYTISMSMALIFASKEKYDIDPNQELLALGAGNCFGAFFGCSPFCASLSRSYIQYQTGAKTNVTSLVSACLILVVLLWIGPFFEQLPRCVLASIIVVSLKGMFMQVKELPRFWAISKLDAVVWLLTFLVTVIVHIDVGLITGLLTSLFALFFRSQTPYTCLLGRVPNTDIYLDVKRYRGVEEIPGLKIFHYCGGLNFATKYIFRSALFRKVGVNEAQRSDNSSGGAKAFWDPAARNDVSCVIIDATALAYVDATGIKTMVAVQRELEEQNITVLFSGANAPVLEMIEKFNSMEKEGLFIQTFPTVHDAVVYYKILESQQTTQTGGVTINKRGSEVSLNLSK